MGVHGIASCRLISINFPVSTLTNGMLNNAGSLVQLHKFLAIHCFSAADFTKLRAKLAGDLEALEIQWLEAHDA